MSVEYPFLVEEFSEEEMKEVTKEVKEKKLVDGAVTFAAVCWAMVELAETFPGSISLDSCHLVVGGDAVRGAYRVSRDGFNGRLHVIVSGRDQKASLRTNVDIVPSRSVWWNVV